MKHIYALQENIRFATSRWQVVLYDGLMVAIAWLLAYWFRFGFYNVSPFPPDWAFAMLPLVVLIHVGMFIGFGVHRGTWRFTATSDILRIVYSVCFGTAVIAVVIFLAPSLSFPPRSVFLNQGVLLFGLLVTSRLVYRAYKS